MRNLILSALLLASAFQTALGQTDGAWTYTVANNQATITGYTGAGGAVVIPSTLNSYPVVSIGGGAFADCRSLTSITIPNSVTSIGEYAFAYDPSLTNVTIPNSVTSIGSYAFSVCNGLISITIPNSVMSIGNGAFEYCPNLGAVVISNGVTNIGSYAFRYCSIMASIVIPNSVTSIGSYAFSGTDLGPVFVPSTASFPPNAFPSNAFFVVGSVGTPTSMATQADLASTKAELANTKVQLENLANNDAFVTAVANKIKATGGNYGLSVKSELETLATKMELTSALTESRTAGVNSVLSNPNLWTLYTTSQIQNMSVGDLVLSRQSGGGFVLNYDIEQSTDLQNWTRYEALSLPLNGLPTDKAFVRIKAKQ